MNNVKKEVKSAVMFGNMGLSEFYEHEANVKTMVSVEFDTRRADIYKCMKPDCHVIPNDVTKEETIAEFVAKAKEYGTTLLRSSPPCQGHSKANQSENKDNDMRNRLFLPVLEVNKRYPHDNIMIENVPEFLDYSSPTVLPELKGATVGEYIERELKRDGYHVTIKQRVDASLYSSTPQRRVRALILASRLGEWKLPPKIKGKPKTIRDIISDLPSLEAGQRSGIKYHNAAHWPERYIETMKRTATGCSAFDNPPEWRPKKVDGTDAAYYRSSYCRPSWDDVFPCVLQGSAGMGGMITCHPGNLKADGTYDNARSWTILELLRSYDLPDDFPFPDWAVDEEQLLRDVLGEGFAPRLVQALLETMPR